MFDACRQSQHLHLLGRCLRRGGKWIIFTEKFGRRKVDANLGGGFTPPKFNIAPEKRWLEDEFPFGKAYF